MSAVRSAQDAVSRNAQEGIAGGDFVAELVRHQRRIYAFIGSLVHHQADIEDLYQQTCLLLWKKHDQYDGSREFLPWACGFAKHEVFNYLRKRDRRGRVYLSEQLLAEIAEEHLRTEAESDARRDLLDDCLAKIHERQRQLLRRCYEGSHTIKEIAADMRISPAALTMRLQRIKQAVLGCIAGSLATEGPR
ncbi:MAG: sigma-70 family RNA polymerase sigma factor [Planctomycetia bacterium]|nr:sigma-70 family RNA polymerase sigma factor [Planctomycetia bacterium]